MHDKFEKEVQRKMEELKLRPSAPVWEKIEMEITPGKKRRRGMLWLFLGALLLGGGAYLAYQSITANEQLTGHRMPTKPLDSIKTSTTSPSLQKQSTSAPSPDTFILHRTPTPVPEPSEIEGNASWQRKKQEISAGNTNRNNKLKVLSPSVEDHVKEDPKKQSGVIISVPIAIQDSKINEKAKTEKEIVTKQESLLLTEDRLQEAVPRYIDSVRTPANKIVQPTTMADSSLKKKVASNKQWHKQATIAIGKSSYSTGPLFSNVVNDLSSSPLSSAAGGSANYKPVETKGAPGFTAGLSFIRKLSEHWELSFGLQYAYYSTTMNVGSSRRNDTTIRFGTGSFSTSQYYTNAGSKEYTNRFHVVEVPVTITYQPSVGLPLYLSFGAAYGRVISTNALTFSSTANLYYQNEENYLRNMLPVFTALQVELFAKKKVSLRVGPTLQYNLLKLRKENANVTPHLSFAGIKTGINF
jgi:hypothetical protein